MNRPATIGAIVKSWRKAEPRQWTTAELARAVGTSRQNIENLEAGAVGNPRYLQALARVMGYASLDDLLDMKPAPGTPAAVSPAPPPWPFELVRRDRVDCLTPVERGIVEGAMIEAINLVENLRAQARGVGQTGTPTREAEPEPPEELNPELPRPLPKPSDFRRRSTDATPISRQQAAGKRPRRG